MLAYCNSGSRDYARNPVTPGRERRLWEFQAVLRGRIARLEPDGSPGNFEASSLWLAAPHSAHGWIGLPGRPAEIVVFHFRYLPEALSQRMQERPFTRIALDAAERQRMRVLSARVRRYWERPAPGMLLCFEAALSELSLLVYEAHAEIPDDEADRARHAVHRALQCYDRRMPENPGLPEVAREAGVSQAQLRRYFQRTFQQPPKALFDQLRDRRIIELLTDTGLNLEEIARQTGFSESSALSRSFRQRFGCPPGKMRPGRGQT